MCSKLNKNLFDKLRKLNESEIFHFGVVHLIVMGKASPHVIISRDRVEMAERVAITLCSYILENPHATIAVTVGVRCGSSMKQNE